MPFEMLSNARHHVTRETHAQVVWKTLADVFGVLRRQHASVFRCIRANSSLVCVTNGLIKLFR